MMQDSLFDTPLTQADVDRGQRGRARRSDPRTSHDAAAQIGKGAEAAIRRVYGIPRWLTDDELCELLPEWHPPTVKSARSRLSKAGWLEDSGLRRPSKRWREQIVWARAVGVDD